MIYYCALFVTSCLSIVICSASQPSVVVLFHKGFEEPVPTYKTSLWRYDVSSERIHVEQQKTEKIRVASEQKATQAFIARRHKYQQKFLAKIQLRHRHLVQQQIKLLEPACITMYLSLHPVPKSTPS